MAPHDPEKLRTRRRLLLLALLGVFVLLGVAGWLASRPERIRRGMTRAEVDARLGPPDGRMLAVEGTAIKDVVLVWKNRGIVIEFDEDDRVREVTRPPSLFDNLRSKFGF
jgi:hypothetical protein